MEQNQNTAGSIIDKIVNDEVERGDWLHVVLRFLHRENPYLPVGVAEVTRGNDLKLIRR